MTNSVSYGILNFPSGWAWARMKDFIFSKAGSGAIKNECGTEEELVEFPFPAFSASGQDVWVRKHSFSKSGIVLSAVGARCGKTFLAEFDRWDSIANTQALFLANKNQHLKFYWYLTNNEDYWLKGGTAQPFVQVSRTLERPFPLPPLAEQKAIADFLDRETSLIDKRLALIEKKRGLLNELRKSVVHEAVTKGLDKNAEMVDSGVEWIGEIPKGWGVCRFTDLIAKIETGKEDASFSDENGDTLFYTCGIETLKCRSAAFYGPAILMAGNGDISNVKLQNSDSPFNAYQRVYVVKTIKSKYLKFAFWLLKAGFFDYVKDLQKGSVIEFIKLGDIKHFPISLPSLSEQKAIAEILDRETGRIDKMLSILGKQEALLKEQRKALVHEIVTGKRRVV